MRGEYQKGKLLARGKDISIGIDVHREKWHITARVEGEEIFYGSMLSDYQCLRKFTERFKDCTVKVPYEAGPCGFGLYDKLSAEGIGAIVVPPSLIPVESGNNKSALTVMVRKTHEYKWIINSNYPFFS